MSGLFRFWVEIPPSFESNMEAYFFAMPAEQGQDGLLLNRQEILTFLHSQGIVFGILEHVIERLVQRGYAHRELIARGLPPLKGSDTHFEVLVTEWHNRYEELFLRLPEPEEDEQWLEHLAEVMIRPQTPLLRRLPACLGAPGRNIFGKLVPGIKGQERPFPTFKNAQISLQDPNLLVATIDGILAVDLPHLIEVLPVTILRRDLLESRFFKGTVIIFGNVPDYIRIQAKSDILILGTVDAAVLISERRIWIRQGVKGKDMAVLKAKEDILVRFAEHATLEAGGNLQAESLQHCYAVSLGKMYVNYILGGISRASTLLWTEIVGSPGVDSMLYCGQNPYLEAALVQTEGQIEHLQHMLQQMQSELSSKAVLGAPDKQILRIHLRNRIPRLEYQLYQLKAYWQRLQSMQAIGQQACIEIAVGSYQGTYLCINQQESTLRELVNHRRRYLAGRYGIVPDRSLAE